MLAVARRIRAAALARSVLKAGGMASRSGPNLSTVTLATILLTTYGVGLIMVMVVLLRA